MDESEKPATNGLDYSKSTSIETNSGIGEHWMSNFNEGSTYVSRVVITASASNTINGYKVSIGEVECGTFSG